ncbi:MAG: OmpA family protein [Leptospiraceae bacterium]|nr:OmpA family protein [Leptospiraceae bacterium]MDW8306513.1 OmpA family protein [Leptospiraceae bacterium]
MKPLLYLPLTFPLAAAFYYTPREYRELESEKYALELELKHLQERYLNERLSFREKIASLEKSLEELQKEYDEKKRQFAQITRQNNEKIVSLEYENQNLKLTLENTQREKAENERLSQLELNRLRGELALLKQEASAKEKALLDEKAKSEFNLISEIKQLKKELFEEREKTRRDMEELSRQHRLKYMELEKNNSELQQELWQKEAENKKLKAKLQELENIKESQRKELEKLAEQARALEEKLKEEITLGGIKLKRLKDRLVINLENKILFDSGSAMLRSDEIRRTLDKIAEILAQYGENQIVIEGHTDDVPIRNEKFRDNWQLSTERAMSVLYHLLRNPKLDPSRFRILGAGPYQPLLPNTTSENRAQNRRVDIVIYPPSP